MNYLNARKEELQVELDAVRKEWESIRAMGLNLDMS